MSVCNERTNILAQQQLTIIVITKYIYILKISTRIAIGRATKYLLQFLVASTRHKAALLLSPSSLAETRAGHSKRCLKIGFPRLQNLIAVRRRVHRFDAAATAKFDNLYKCFCNSSVNFPLNNNRNKK